MPARREREVLVAGGSETKAQKGRTAAEIVSAVKSNLDGKGEIIGARRLPSGIIALTFKSAAAKDQWKEAGQVGAVFGEGALIKESTIDVIVFSFPAKAISGLQPERRIAAIVAQNSGLKSSIKRAGVIKLTITRRYKAVILGLSSPIEANAVINSGVL